MKKGFRKMSLVLALTMGFSLLTGCSSKKGNSDGSLSQTEMIDKYSAYCDLGEYKGVEYVETKTDIDNGVLDSEIQSFLSYYATSETVTSGTAEMGDTVNIDFTGTVDGVEFEGGSTNGAGSELTLGSGRTIDGFEAQIAGHDVGETFDIYVTFPEDYGKEELNGKDAVFEITINGIIEQTLPEYTDETVSTYTSYATMEEFENAIRQSYADNDEYYNKVAIIEAVVDNATINEYPEQAMQELIDTTIEQTTKEAEGYGYDLESYVVARYGMASEEDFKEYISGLAEDFMTEKIVICAIAKAENITASDDEIKEYKNSVMDTYSLTEDELYEIYTQEDIIYYALSEKVYDFLLENGVPVEASSEDETATSEDAEEVTTEETASPEDAEETEE